MIVWVFVAFLAPFTDAGKSCEDAFECPGYLFDANSVIDYTRDETVGVWRMKVHKDFFDNFCPFYAKFINCTKDYDSACEGVRNYKGLLQTIRATYEEICVQYKTDIEALIEPCFNDLGHQTQLIDVCYNILVRYMKDRKKTPETIEACRGPEEWASCVNDVLVQCNPEKAYVFPLVYEAAKPYICNV